MVFTGSVQVKIRRVQPAGIFRSPLAFAAIDWLDSGIYWNAQQARTCCGYQRQSGPLLIGPAGARYLVWSQLWYYIVCSDAVPGCDVDRRCSDIYQSRTSTPSGHQSALQGVPNLYLSGSTHNVSSVLTPSSPQKKRERWQRLRAPGPFP